MHMMISKHHEAGKLVCVIFEQMFLTTNIYIVRHHQKYNKSTTINEDNTYPVE